MSQSGQDLLLSTQCIAANEGSLSQTFWFFSLNEQLCQLYKATFRDSTSIACPKDAIHKGTNSCLSNMLSVEKVASINKHTSPTIPYQEDENHSLR